MNNRRDINEVYQLSRGDYVRILAAPAFVMDAAQARIPNPPVPEWEDPESGEKIPHYDSPAYQQALELVKREREVAAMRALIDFSIVLVNEQGEEIGPPDNGWESKVEKYGPEINRDDQDERRLAYLMYVALGAEDIEFVMKTAGLSNPQQAEATFRGN